MDFSLLDLSFSLYNFTASITWECFFSLIKLELSFCGMLKSIHGNKKLILRVNMFLVTFRTYNISSDSLLFQGRHELLHIVLKHF